MKFIAKTEKQEDNPFTYMLLWWWCMNSQRETYGNACIQAFWPFQLALTLWDSKRIITKGSHLVSRLVWNGKEWKRWTCELPHINLLHSVKLYVHLKIGTEKKRRKMKWSKMKSVSLHFSFKANYTPALHTHGRKNWSNWTKRLNQFSTNFQPEGSRACIATCLERSSTVQYYTWLT